MKHWRRKGDRIVTKLDRHEAALLRTLVEQVRELLTERAESAPQDELAGLTGIRTGPTTAPEHPALARLLPDFHRLDGEETGSTGDTGSTTDTANAGDTGSTDDTGSTTDSAGAGNTGAYRDSAAALRSLHEPELVDRKVGVAAVVLETVPADGGAVSIDEDAAGSWLAALNDVRLAMGALIGVSEDMPEQLPSDDPRAGQLNVYHWLTWMQDSLLRVL